MVDPFLTDTARVASVVLPTTTLLEEDDWLGAYGHIGASQPIVPAPPDVETDLEIIQALAPRVALGRELAGSARDWKRRLVEPRLSAHGVSLEDLERAPLQNPLAPEVLLPIDASRPPPGVSIC